jgi:hypothetical protein
VPRDKQFFTSSGAGHKQQATFTLEILLVGLLVFLDRCHGIRGRNQFRAHPGDADAPELKALHSVHCSDAYGVFILGASVEHRRSKYLNNRIENSHQPTRQRERAMKRFTSPGHAQRFLSAFSGISPHFRPGPHRLTAPEWRAEMADRFTVWREVTAAVVA